jgi:zinc-ribbon domain
MKNSATSISQSATSGTPGFQVWHFFVLLSMLGATAAVMVSRETHPAALVLLSAAVICAGLVGLTISRAVSGFLNRGYEGPPLPPHSRDQILKEKSLVLRSIKELEFDKAMGKISEADFGSIGGRLRARAVALMEELDRVPAAPARDHAPAVGEATKAQCKACGTRNDPDAKFCKNCGATLSSRAPEERR